MAEWMIQIAQFLISWFIRMVVLASLVSHLVLALLAGVRRRKAIGGRMFFLLLAYKVGDWAATYALGSLSLGSTSQEEQLVTFWGAFLLLHLGGPDNITAYSFEDNVLSGRQMIELTVQVMGAIIAIFKNIVASNGGTMLWISLLLFFIGIAKYWERTLALKRANLENLRSSINKEKKLREGRSRNVRRGCGCSRDNEQALLAAHGLLYITKDAFVDHFPGEDVLQKNEARRQHMFSRGWKEMYKVVDMELSLMYDILYTKAAMVHTWGGYLVRFISPHATAGALLLFWSDSKEGQRWVDILITYALLTTTVVLDVAWLLRAMASTWTYSFLNDRPRCWLHHAFLCSGRWHLLRRLVVSLDPLQLFLSKEPSSYRMWSGTIGQYNMFDECTDGSTTSTFGSMLKVLASLVVPEESWMEYQYHYSRGRDISTDHVKGVLFDQIWRELKKAYPPLPDKEPAKKKDQPKAHPCPPPPPPAPVNHAAINRRDLEEALNFDPAFQETVLIWHIATDMFLVDTHQYESSSPNVQAIKALSNYMVFLVVVRPGMLPGLKLRSLYESTREALGNICGSKQPGNSIKRKEHLCDLLKMEEQRTGVTPTPRSWRPGYSAHKNRPRNASALYDKSVILSDGTKFAEVLLSRSQSNIPGLELMDSERYKRLLKTIPELAQSDKLDMLRLILAAWVRLLMYASVRCTRDSHTKQLARGGELTTIIWILAEHAAIFRIPYDENETGQPPERRWWSSKGATCWILAALEQEEQGGTSVF
ncbi:hypothetical protein ABZP36_030724 [Zizania latifolia]